MKLLIEIDMSGEEFRKDAALNLSIVLDEVQDIFSDNILGKFPLQDSCGNPCGKLEVVE